MPLVFHSSPFPEFVFNEPLRLVATVTSESCSPSLLVMVAMGPLLSRYFSAGMVTQPMIDKCRPPRSVG